MALVTVHRSPTPSSSPETQSCDLLEDYCSEIYNLKSPPRSHSFSESYLAVKGAALILSQSECMRTVTPGSSTDGGGIKNHLQAMLYLLRSQSPDKIKLAVKLESRMSHNVLTNTTPCRYMALVSTMDRQDLEESVILGIDICDEQAKIGLVLPIWGDLDIRLDGDGGFNITTNGQLHNFKPVSVQTMWSALQSLIKVRDIASHNNYYPNGLTHTWVSYYSGQVNSDQCCINEWHAIVDVDSHSDDLSSGVSSPLPGSAQLQKEIRSRLKQIMMKVDLEDVTSKYLRTRLEEEMGTSLTEFKRFIDDEMIIILRQMDAPSEIFDYLYLGSEWNAGNLEELKQNGVGYILNVTKEIDNFFPEMFQYKNIRIYDSDEADLLIHWDNTYKFISQARDKKSKVLVHCKMGVSRSASTVIAFVMKEKGWPLEKAKKYVHEKRSCIQPNPGFKLQLATYEGILDASKQRHNKLWRSASSGNLQHTMSIASHSRVSTPIHCSTVNKPAGHQRSPDGNKPRSWSPNDNITQILFKTHVLASDSGTTSEEDQSESYDFYNVNHDSNTDESPSFPLLFSMDNWEEFDMSPSDSQEDLTSLQWNDRTNEDVQHKISAVVLLSYQPITIDDQQQDGQDLSSTAEDSDLEDLVTEEDIHRQCGFYDVSMLYGYRTHAEELSQEAFDVRTSDEYDLPYELHPDMVLERLQAEQRKHRRTAQLIMLSESDKNLSQSDRMMITDDPGQSNFDACQTSQLLLTKVRPDNFWIKENQMSPLVQDPDFIDCEVLDKSKIRPICISSSTSKESLKSVGNSSYENVKDDILEVIEREETPLFHGSVRRQTLDYEGRVRSKTDESLNSLSPTNDSLVSTALSEKLEMETSKSSGDCSKSPEDVFQQMSSPDKEIGRTRPSSIYDSEEISLEPGIVMRTKLEIELRERSGSLAVDATPLPDVKPVQRSSSWRLDRTTPERCKSKDRNCERRRTCLPVLAPSPPCLGNDIGLELMCKEPVAGISLDASEDLKCVGLAVYKIGLEEVELEEGIVRRTKQGFEEKLKEDPVVSVVVPLKDNERVQTTNEIPVESGLVRRQTKHLETKYSSSNLASSRDDVRMDDKFPFDICPLDSESAFHSMNSTDGDRYIVPEFSKHGRTEPDRPTSKLSLSLKRDAVVFQSGSSPLQPRKEFIQVPSDITQKELNSKMSHLVRESSLDDPNAKVSSTQILQSWSSSVGQGLKMDRSATVGCLEESKYFLNSSSMDVFEEDNSSTFNRSHSFRESSPASAVQPENFRRSWSLRLPKKGEADNSKLKSVIALFETPPVGVTNALPNKKPGSKRDAVLVTSSSSPCMADARLKFPQPLYQDFTNVSTLSSSPAVQVLDRIREGVLDSRDDAVSVPSTGDTLECVQLSLFADNTPTCSHCIPQKSYCKLSVTCRSQTKNEVKLKCISKSIDNKSTDNDESLQSSEKRDDVGQTTTAADEKIVVPPSAAYKCEETFVASAENHIHPEKFERSVISTGILVSNRESFSKADRIASDDKITETSDSRTEFTGSMNVTDKISNKISASGKNSVSGIQAQEKLASEMITKSEHSMVKSEANGVILSAAFCDTNINDSLNSCGEKILVVDSSKNLLDRSLRECPSELKQSGSHAVQNLGIEIVDQSSRDVPTHENDRSMSQKSKRNYGKTHPLSRLPSSLKVEHDSGSPASS